MGSDFSYLCLSKIYNNYGLVPDLFNDNNIKVSRHNNRMEFEYSDKLITSEELLILIEQIEKRGTSGVYISYYQVLYPEYILCIY